MIDTKYNVIPNNLVIIIGYVWPSDLHPNV